MAAPDQAPYIRGEKWFGLASSDNDTHDCRPYIDFHGARKANRIHLYCWQRAHLFAWADSYYDGDLQKIHGEANQAIQRRLFKFIWPVSPENEYTEEERQFLLDKTLSWCDLARKTKEQKKQITAFATKSSGITNYRYRAPDGGSSETIRDGSILNQGPRPPVSPLLIPDAPILARRHAGYPQPLQPAGIQPPPSQAQSSNAPHAPGPGPGPAQSQLVIPDGPIMARFQHLNPGP